MELEEAIAHLRSLALRVERDNSELRRIIREINIEKQQAGSPSCPGCAYCLVQRGATAASPSSPSTAPVRTEAVSK